MNTMMTLQSGGAGDGAHTRMTQAWQWLCDQRSTAPDAADIRDIHHQQASQDAWLRELTDRVLRGEYRLSPVQLFGQGESRRAVWGAQDALVLKWVALGIQSLLPLHPACEHVKGHGGGKPSIRTLHHLLTETEKKTAADTTPADSADARGYRWVCRTDIRGYYRNINKATLLNQVRQSVHDPVLTDLVNQYIHYTVEDGGTFHTPQKGISRGCPLSPLMGAVHLYEMDAYFAQQKDIHYARYMDDIIILAKSRWSLRRHTKRLKQWFSEEGFEAHPDKTQIGRTEKGFDWMGAWLTHEGVRDIAPRAKANHREKVRRLYEQLARVPFWRRKRAGQQVRARVSAYRTRWNIWVGGGLLLAATQSCTAATGSGPFTIQPSLLDPNTSVAEPFHTSTGVITFAPNLPKNDIKDFWLCKTGAGARSDCWKVGIGDDSPGSGYWVKAPILYNGHAVLSTSELAPCGIGLAFANGTFLAHFGEGGPVTGAHPEIDIVGETAPSASAAPASVSLASVTATLVNTGGATASACTVKTPIKYLIGVSNSFQQAGGSGTYGLKYGNSLIVATNDNGGQKVPLYTSITIAPGTFYRINRQQCGITTQYTSVSTDVSRSSPTGSTAPTVVSVYPALTITMSCSGGQNPSVPVSISWSRPATDAAVGNLGGADDATGPWYVGLGVKPLSIGAVAAAQDFLADATKSLPSALTLSPSTPLTLHPVLVDIGSGLAAVGTHTVTGTLTYVTY